MAGGAEDSVLGERLDLSENLLPSFNYLRERGRIIPRDGVVPVPADWLATDRETVAYVLRHPELFSSAGDNSYMGTDRPMIPLEVDPPDHVRYRRLLDPFFSPKRLRQLEPSLRVQINEFIDSFIDLGHADLLREFFIPYPTQVFLTLYGLPIEDRPLFLQWKDDMIRGGRLDIEVGRRAVRELTAYMERHFATKRGEDGLLGQLLAQTRQPDGLTEQEVLDITILFVLAGLDTVTTALTHGFAYLAAHPDQRQVIESTTLLRYRWRSRSCSASGSGASCARPSHRRCRGRRCHRPSRRDDLLPSGRRKRGPR